MVIRFSVLGPLEVRVDGAPVRLAGPKQRLLLSALLAQRNRPVSSDVLVEALWSGRPPRRATAVLQNHVSMLRKVLDAGTGGTGRQLLDTVTAGYALTVGIDQLDASVFEQLAASGHQDLAQGLAAEAARLLREALALWRGPAYADAADRDPVHLEARRLDGLRLVAIEERVEADLAGGRHTVLADELESLVTEHPLRERLWAQLMRCLYRSGRQTDALRAYERLRRRLADELGLEPGPEIVQLERDILLHAPSLAWSPQQSSGHAASALGLGSNERMTVAATAGGINNGASVDRALSTEAGPHNLPVPRGPLIGREAEVVELVAAVGEHRLVTLLGLGGTGKTRLAVAVAYELLDGYPDGVWFVDLAPVDGPDRLVEAAAAAAGLSLPGGENTLRQLCLALGGFRALIVLDNCEHIGGAVAELVDLLLELTIGPRVLTTSREPLNLPDERQFHVAPLSVEERLDSPAVALFVVAARRVGTRITAEHVSQVAAICRRLDGLPLALELAAAQLRQLQLDELLDRLDQRFELLERDRRGVRARQASLVGVLEDSWSLLNGAEQRLLLMLAAFPGSFDLAAAEGVADGAASRPIARLLAGLVDRGLVVNDGQGGHRLLDTVRLFARRYWAQLGPDEQPSDLHAEWCLRHFTLYPYGARHASEELARWVTDHHHDLFAAEAHLAATGRRDDVVELLSAQSYTLAIGFIGSATGPASARLQDYLGHWDLDPVSRGRMLLTLAGCGLAGRCPDWFAGSAHAIDLLADSDNEIDLAAAEIIHSWTMALRDTPSALAVTDRAITRAQAAGSSDLARAGRSYRAIYLVVAQRMEEARAELAALRQEMKGTPFDYAWRNYYMASAAAGFISDPARSLASMDTCARKLSETSSSLAVSSLLLATMAAANDDIDRVRRHLDEAVDLQRRISADDGLPDLLLPLIVAAWRQGDHNRARHWLTAVRHAPRPTQNFIVTAVYRQMRDLLGFEDEKPGAPVNLTFSHALRWLEARPRAERELLPS